MRRLCGCPWAATAPVRVRAAAAALGLRERAVYRLSRSLRRVRTGSTGTDTCALARCARAKPAPPSAANQNEGKAIRRGCMRAQRAEKGPALCVAGCGLPISSHRGVFSYPAARVRTRALLPYPGLRGVVVALTAHAGFGSSRRQETYPIWQVGDVPSTGFRRDLALHDSVSPSKRLEPRNTLRKSFGFFALLTSQLPPALRPQTCLDPPLPD